MATLYTTRFNVKLSLHPDHKVHFVRISEEIISLYSISRVGFLVFTARYELNL